MCNGKLPCMRSSGEDFKIKLIFQDGLLQGDSNLNRLHIDLSPSTRYERESSINRKQSDLFKPLHC